MTEEEENMINEGSPAAPKMVRAAKLNAAGVFIGIEELPEDELTPHHLPEITDCDLPPHKYRWDDGKQCFLALPKKALEDSLSEPHALRAIVLGFIAVKNSGITLPKETLDYIAWYQSTIDFKG